MLMKHMLYTILTCTLLTILASCNQKVRDGRVIFGAIVDSNGKAIANHDFNVDVTKRTGVS
jgi:hypothetical protein